MPPHRLLFVEDEPAIARAVIRLLKRDGYEVDLAGSHAESLIYSDTYECGVFDITLPDSDGVELADRLRSRGVVKHVVFFSGVDDADVERRARQTGIFVHKTEGVSRLRAAIAALLSA